jgi:hypothetical protein
MNLFKTLYRPLILAGIGNIAALEGDGLAAGINCRNR